MKEQKLHEYIKRQKHKENQSPADRVKGHSRKDPLRTHQNERQLNEGGSSGASRGHGGDIRTRERGQYSLKSRSEESHQGHNRSPNRHHSDAGALRERKMEEREMVRSWTKARRK